MVASTEHVSHDVLGPEGDEYTPWSRLPPTHQHKPPHPRANTKSTQPLVTHDCGQMHSAQSTGIAGSAHCINRERTTKGQPTCRKGYLELQPMEMTLISLIPSMWVLFCQLRAMHLMERHREKLIHNDITFHFLHKSESQSHQRMLLVQKELTYAPIKFHFISNHIYICHTKKLNLIVDTHIKQLLTLNAFWIQLKWIAQLHSRDDKKITYDLS